MSAEPLRHAGVLRGGWGPRLVALASVAGCLAITWGMFRHPISDVSPIVVWLFLGLGVSLLLVSAAIRAKALVDEDGLEEVTSRGTPVRRAWNEVTRIHSDSQNIVITWEGGRHTIVPLAYTGLDVLAYFVLTRVPPTLIATDVTLRRLAYLARRRRPVPTHAFAPESLDQVREAALRWRDNPFAVLGLAPDCSRADVERTGQKLLGLLAIGHAAARTYQTPFERDVERTEHRVRAAMAELRTPERRIAHELWARVPALSPAESSESDPAPFRWETAMEAVGWRRG